MPANAPGIGTATEGISSDFTQGDLTATGNPLDAAIQGNGYFMVNSNGSQQYTRDGAFQLNSDGQLTNRQRRRRCWAISRRTARSADAGRRSP